MNFSFQRHTRIAGSVAVLVGFLLHNWSVILFGNLIIALGYMWSVAKIENHLEKEEDDASGEER